MVHDICSWMEVSFRYGILGPVLRIRIWIRRIRMFLGLLYPDPHPLVRGIDPDPDPDPSISKHK